MLRFMKANEKKKQQIILLFLYELYSTFGIFDAHILYRSISKNDIVQKVYCGFVYYFLLLFFSLSSIGNRNVNVIYNGSRAHSATSFLQYITLMRCRIFVK